MPEVLRTNAMKYSATGQTPLRNRERKRTVGGAVRASYAEFGWSQLKMPGTKVIPVETMNEEFGLRPVRERVARLTAVLERFGRFSPCFQKYVRPWQMHCMRCKEVFEGYAGGKEKMPEEHFETASSIFFDSVSKRESILKLVRNDMDRHPNITEFLELINTALMMEKIHKAICCILDAFKAEQRMRDGYAGIFKYFVTTGLLLIVVCAQRGFGQSRAEMYQAIKGEMFGSTKSVTTPEININQYITDAQSLYCWLDSHILSRIFDDESCGDGVCHAPEEFPLFSPGSGAREFAGCKADCGIIPTRRVQISFYDPWKLWYATKHMEAAVKWGWRGQTSTTWNSADRFPGAGWNLCAINHTEYGGFDEVCIFDGDIEIDGKWYRSAELDANSSNFGSSIELDVFEATWELRIAYVNFSWPKLEGF